MFSQACVKNSVHRGGGCIPAFTGHWAGGVCMYSSMHGGVCPGDVSAWGLSAQGVCLEHVHSPGPEADTPPPQTANAADSTHHTGMHSCSKCTHLAMLA